MKVIDTKSFTYTVSVLSHIFIGSELNYERDTEMFLWVESRCIVGPCPQSNQVERQLMFIRSQVLCCTLAHYANNPAVLAVMLLCKSMHYKIKDTWFLADSVHIDTACVCVCENSKCWHWFVSDLNRKMRWKPIKKDLCRHSELFICAHYIQMCCSHSCDAPFQAIWRVLNNSRDAGGIKRNVCLCLRFSECRRVCVGVGVLEFGLLGYQPFGDFLYVSWCIWNGSNVCFFPLNQRNHCFDQTTNVAIQIIKVIFNIKHSTFIFPKIILIFDIKCHTEAFS